MEVKGAMSTVQGIVKASGQASGRRRTDLFDSWKEIATYLCREVRTIQRWERFEDLPVRRLFHRKASSVYAFAEELDAWLEARGPSHRGTVRAKALSRKIQRNDLVRKLPGYPGASTSEVA